MFLIGDKWHIKKLVINDNKQKLKLNILTELSTKQTLLNIWENLQTVKKKTHIKGTIINLDYYSILINL